MIPEKIRQALRNTCYFVFGNLTKIKTTFFSNTFIATGYFLKSEAEYRKSPAINKICDRMKLHDHLATTYLHPGDKIHYLEFGVLRGQIISKWSANNINPESKFTGFDTFTGLPENWANVKKGSFSNKGVIPQIDDDRTNFCVGLVQDTLPPYIKNINPSYRIISHLDFDLYNATLFTLLSLQPLLKSGDLIILDEYFSISKNHYEYRAFADFLSLYKIQYKPLYKCRSGHYVIEVI
ncbi:MAG: TylF/MycF/NovP-related O-methyltransferase [Ginsengibacter sp.]